MRYKINGLLSMLILCLSHALYGQSETVKVSVSMRDFATNQLIANGVVKLLDQKTKQFTNATYNAAKQTYELMIPKKTSFSVIVTATGYDEASASMYDVDSDREITLIVPKSKQKITKNEPPKQTLPSPPPPDKPLTASIQNLEKGKTIVMNRIYFDQSSPTLKTESATQLDELVAVLIQNPQTQLEIRGHTDNVGDFDLNVKLSQARAQAVVSYLTQKGIAASRLRAVGRGPLDAVSPNNTEESRKKNRRVELLVL